MKEKAKRYLIYGIAGGILTMIGDCLLEYESRSNHYIFGVADSSANG